MNRKALSFIVLGMLLITSTLSFSALGLKIENQKSQTTDVLLKYNGNTLKVPDDYPTIQSAINAAESGDTVSVRNGVYEEEINIDKSISLMGENKEKTIIKKTNKYKNIITISADDVNIVGFTLKGDGELGQGINIKNINNAYIFNNILIDNHEGFYIYKSININLLDNKFILESVLNCRTGANIWESSNIFIRDNKFNMGGIGKNGIAVFSSRDVTIKNNEILNCGGPDIKKVSGVLIVQSSKINFYENIVKNNLGYGLKCSDGYSGKDDVKIYHNSFISNGLEGVFLLSCDGYYVFLNNFIDNNNKKTQGYDQGYWNNWYDEGSLKGNYWNDYSTRYPNAIQNLVTGTWSTPYDISGGSNTQDKYPLLQKWEKSRGRPRIFDIDKFQFIQLFYKILERFPILNRLLNLQ